MPLGYKSSLPNFKSEEAGLIRGKVIRSDADSQADLTSRPRHGFLPSFVQAFAFALSHLWLEAFFFPPLRGDLLFALPEIDGQAGQVSGAERGRFSDHGTHDRDAQNVGLELAEEIVAGRAAVDSKLFSLDA